MNKLTLLTVHFIINQYNSGTYSVPRRGCPPVGRVPGTGISQRFCFLNTGERVRVTLWQQRSEEESF